MEETIAKASNNFTFAGVSIQDCKHFRLKGRGFGSLFFLQNKTATIKCVAYGDIARVSYVLCAKGNVVAVEGVLANKPNGEIYCEVADIFCIYRNRAAIKDDFFAIKAAYDPEIILKERKDHD